LRRRFAGGFASPTDSFFTEDGKDFRLACAFAAGRLRFGSLSDSFTPKLDFEDFEESLSLELELSSEPLCSAKSVSFWALSISS
jgi:hypothetical protein